MALSSVRLNEDGATAGSLTTLGDADTGEHVSKPPIRKLKKRLEAEERP